VLSCSFLRTDEDKQTEPEQVWFSGVWRAGRSSDTGVRVATATRAWVRPAAVHCVRVRGRARFRSPAPADEPAGLLELACTETFLRECCLAVADVHRDGYPHALPVSPTARHTQASTAANASRVRLAADASHALLAAGRCRRHRHRHRRHRLWNKTPILLTIQPRPCARTPITKG
jgi:hypothetical protein